MYIEYFLIPENKKPSDLEKKVSNIFNELEVSVSQEFSTNSQVYKLLEIPNIGAINFTYSTTGNDIPTVIHYHSKENKNISQRKVNVGGFIFLLGFDESTEYFKNFVENIYSALETYILKEDLTQNTVPSFTIPELLETFQ